MFGVPGGESDDRRHDDAPVPRQPLDEACGTALVSEPQADAGFQLVGLGEKDGVPAFQRRPRRGQRGEGLIVIAARSPDPGPVQLGKVIEGGPGAADNLQSAFYRFGSSGQIVTLQSEQRRCPQRVEGEIVTVKTEAAGRSEGPRGRRASLFRGPLR